MRAYLMNKKRAVFVFIGFLIIFFGTAFIQFQGKILPKKGEEIQNTITVKQIIIDGERKKEFKIKIAPKSTTLKLLYITCNIVTKGQKENAFITAINGRMADPNKREFWAFYVNGVQAQVGAGTYVVKNNDTIEWKIETY